MEGQTNKHESLKAFLASASHTLASLEDTESDLGSVLVQINDLQQRAKKGFYSDRVNMKSDDGGVSRLNESMPAIELGCINAKLKVQSLIVDYLTCDEVQDTNITVNVVPRRLEDSL